MYDTNNTKKEKKEMKRSQKELDELVKSCLQHIKEHERPQFWCYNGLYAGCPLAHVEYGLNSEQILKKQKELHENIKCPYLGNKFQRVTHNQSIELCLSCTYKKGDAKNEK